ncbi:MAG: hypothetical protein ACH34Y_00675 [Brachymonas sp.]
MSTAPIATNTDTDTKAAASAPAEQKSGPWYRYPLVWLVISGPFIVVVAAIYSASIAYRGADLVVQDQRDATREHAMRDVTEDKQAHPDLVPADKARKMGAGADSAQGQ